MYYLNGLVGMTGASSSFGGGTPTYVRTPDGTPIARHTAAGSEYYLTDNLGSVVGMVTTSGTKTAAYAYDPYGAPRHTSGTSAAANPIRYTGGYLDTTTGLYKLGHRYYDPTLGRFTQPDPSGQEANAYLYAFANPVNWTDLSGLSPWDRLKKFAKGLIKRAPLVCYIGNAIQDTDESIEDELRDLNKCFNPYSFLSEHFRD